MLVYSNIFQPRNDWAVASFRCRRNYDKGEFYKSVASIIEEAIGENPFKMKNFRGRSNALSRQIFFDMMRKHTAMTLKDIGNYLGKGHDTVIHSIKQIENLIETDRKFRYTYNKIDIRVKQLNK